MPTIDVPSTREPQIHHALRVISQAPVEALLMHRYELGEAARNINKAVFEGVSKTTQIADIVCQHATVHATVDVILSEKFVSQLEKMSSRMTSFQAWFDRNGTRQSELEDRMTAFFFETDHAWGLREPWRNLILLVLEIGGDIFDATLAEFYLHRCNASKRDLAVMRQLREPIRRLGGHLKNDKSVMNLIDQHFPCRAPATTFRSYREAIQHATKRRKSKGNLGAAVRKSQRISRQPPELHSSSASSICPESVPSHSAPLASRRSPRLSDTGRNNKQVEKTASASKNGAA